MVGKTVNVLLLVQSTLAAVNFTGDYLWNLLFSFLFWKTGRKYLANRKCDFLLKMTVKMTTYVALPIPYYTSCYLKQIPTLSFTAFIMENESIFYRNLMTYFFLILLKFPVFLSDLRFQFLIVATHCGTCCNLGASN